MQPEEKPCGLHLSEANKSEANKSEANNPIRIYEIRFHPSSHYMPSFQLRDEAKDESEFDRGANYIDKIFDFTQAFDDLGVWDSAKELDQHVCDEALPNIRRVLLQLQTRGIRPRLMTAEEIAYYRFPEWWFGHGLSKEERLCILMRHLLDMYNEIRLREDFRAETEERLFYCCYSPRREPPLRK